MSLRNISRFLLVTLLMGALLPLAAQTTNTGKSSTDDSNQQPGASGSKSTPGYEGETKPAKVEVYTGYSWMNLGSTINGVKGGVPAIFNLKDARGGVLVDVSFFFNRWVGITVDSGAHFGNKYDADEIFVGPTLRFPSEHLQLFIHGLGGWHRLSPGNAEQNDGAGFAVGGGLDLKVARHMNIRLAEADYLWSSHDFGKGNPSTYDGARLSAGLVFLAGIGEEVPVSATCSVDRSEVWMGEPVRASVTPHNFNPKHRLNYEWTTNGGKVEGTGDAVTINTTGVAEGQSYNASVHVTDPKNKKAVASCQTSFATKRRLPPTISCSANPDSVEQGGSIAIHSNASSPQGGPVTVAIQSNCGVTGQGADVPVDTSSLQPGSCSVTCTVTDDHQLTASNSTSFTVRPKPVPPPPTPPPTITLRSVYFVTAHPTVKNPDRGLIKSQEETLISIANDFKTYIQDERVRDAKLNLQGFCDPRGGDAYNQKLSERRVAITKNFLVAQGVPENSFLTAAYGKSRQLSKAELKAELDKNPELNRLTPGERARILKNMRTIELASNRRVDISLNTPGQDTVREYPFRASDWLTLIGGREKEKPVVKKKPTGPKTPKKPAPGKKPAKKK
jgi:outer membrane protein OmpA-like peptidoglycan-associated protein